jgi:hypothetical protein
VKQHQTLTDAIMASLFGDDSSANIERADIILAQQIMDHRNQDTSALIESLLMAAVLGSLVTLKPTSTIQEMFDSMDGLWLLAKKEILNHAHGLQHGVEAGVVKRADATSAMRSYSSGKAAVAMGVDVGTLDHDQVLAAEDNLESAIKVHIEMNEARKAARAAQQKESPAAN